MIDYADKMKKMSVLFIEADDMFDMIADIFDADPSDVSVDEDYEGDPVFAIGSDSVNYDLLQKGVEKRLGGFRLKDIRFDDRGGGFMIFASNEEYIETVGMKRCYLRDIYEGSEEEIPEKVLKNAYVEIAPSDELDDVTDFWICMKGFGSKIYMFGLEHFDINSKEAIVNMLKPNALNYAIDFMQRSWPGELSKFFGERNCAGRRNSSANRKEKKNDKR